MSMTAQYDPYENAIAERINRTLKYEYGLRNCIKNTAIAQEITKQVKTVAKSELNYFYFLDFPFF
jgi:putative transposase